MEQATTIKLKRGRKPDADRPHQLTLRIPQSIFDAIRAKEGSNEGDVQNFIRSSIDERLREIGAK